MPYFKHRCCPGSISNLLFLKFPTNKCSLLSWKIPRNKKKNDTLITLINQSQEIRPQGLDLGRSTSIRGQIKTLRPYFSIFSITVVRICLRKQQSKFFTNMLTTPSIEPVNIWFDSAAPCRLYIKLDHLASIFNCNTGQCRWFSTYY